MSALSNRRARIVAKRVADEIEMRCNRIARATAIATIEQLYGSVELTECGDVTARQLRRHPTDIYRMTTLRVAPDGGASLFFVGGAPPNKRQRGALYALASEILTSDDDEPDFF